MNYRYLLQLICKIISSSRLILDFKLSFKLTRGHLYTSCDHIICVKNVYISCVTIGKAGNRQQTSPRFNGCRFGASSIVKY